MSIASSCGKRFNLHYSGHATDSVNGVGIIVERTRKVHFKPISERVCRIETSINNNQKLTLISAYAPTLDKSEKNPDVSEQFYNELNSVVTTVRKRNFLLVAGDFNAKTGSAFSDQIYTRNIGKYGKGEVNSNGYQLLEFAKTNDLKLTNTFFKHKQCHRTTWEAPDRINGCIDSKHNEPRRNPYRNQTDYICARIDDNLKITDARSYGGMSCKSDHKLVLVDTQFKWPYVKEPKKEPAIDNAKLSDTALRQAYTDETQRLITAMPVASNNQQRWNNIVEATTTAAKTILGVKAKLHTMPNPAVEQLSVEQKKLKLDRDVSIDVDKREELRKERNRLLNEIHRIKAADETAKIDMRIREIESAKNDSTRMFAAVKELKRMKPIKPLLLKDGDSLTANPESQVAIIQEHFQRQFNQGREPTPNLTPTAMRHPFTSGEICMAKAKLRNGRSPGYDNVIAEYIKYAPKEVDELIAEILNIAAATGDVPKELVQGILYALQKPGKTMGPVEHLRPIILLSMLRKIAAICMRERTIVRVDEVIPNTQAAYRRGRSTTEHVFAAKILAEKAITSVDYTIHVLLLDMSKAFDTVDRKMLIDDLSKVINEDELHMLNVMINVQLAVRCGTRIGDFFTTDVGVPQGDGYSANEFTFYLANSLQDTEYKCPVYTEHSYAKVNPDSHLRIDGEFADDMNKITTDNNTIEHYKNNLPGKLQQRNLHMNATKTEQYAITRGGDVLWKDCKLLGSLLDTDSDIKRRTGLAVGVICELKCIFYSTRLCIKIKVRVFDVFVTSIFMYNAELWTLTATKEKKIDSLHRRLLRKACLNVRWPRIATNEEVYTRTGAKPWSQRIRKRAWSWFGHLSRLPQDSPAQQALDYATRPARRPRGKPATTWISMMKKRFADIGLS